MRQKYKLIFHCINKNGCRCFRELVNEQFDITVTSENSVFKEGLKKSDADAAVICLTTAERNSIEEFLKVESVSGYVPLISSTQKLFPEFVNKAADKGGKKLLRIIWVYQAVRLLEKTKLVNYEIARQLNYKDLDSMDRDFRMVLKNSPTEIRKTLLNININKLFPKIQKN